MPAEQITARLIIHHESEVQLENRFAEDVRAGLTAKPKKLKPKYFYDTLGSYLFEAICHLPEYYPTRAETEIFARHAPEIIGWLPGPVTMVELGSGSSVKTRHLIESLLSLQGELHYQPIDISPAILKQSAEQLLEAYPALHITAQARDYTRGLGEIVREKDERILALFLGSNIGNYDPPDAINLLQKIRGNLRAGDGLLLGADLKKSSAVLELAYDDALGVTAAFNLNLLLRINRELGGNFDLNNFAHRALYNEREGRVEMHLMSWIEQTARIESLDLTITLQKKETIHTESSYKYDFSQLMKMADAAGFEYKRFWMDTEERFSCNLWQAV